MKIIFKISFYSVIFSTVFNIPSDMNNSKICPKNMKLYDFEDNNGLSEICDCEDTLLYHPENQTCYDAYRKGPCSSEYYFVLPPGEIMAKCVPNPCRTDGLVPYKGQCHQLWKNGSPCSDNNTYLGINGNFQIECDDETKQYTQLRISIMQIQIAKGIINAPAKACPSGSKRVLILGCKQVF